MKRLTEKQYAVMTYIEKFTEQNGMPPTVYEIAEYFHLKNFTIFAHLRALQKKNCLTRTSKARSISLRTGAAGVEKKRLPASLMRAEFGGATRKPALFFSEFMLKNVKNACYVWVTDDTLSEFSLFPGDLLFVERSRSPEKDDLLVRIEGKKISVFRFSESSGKEFDGVLSAVLHRF